MLLGIILLNYRKKATVDGIIAMAFMYAKCAVGGLYYMLDGMLFAIFVVANIGMQHLQSRFIHSC